jgi:hypothetical protein
MLIPRATLLALTADQAPPQPIATADPDGDYWLGHCEGFRVETPHGGLGIVESVVYASREPAYLAVTSGWLLLHTELVPCSDVVSIDARHTRLDVPARPARRSLSTTVADGARRVSHRRGSRPAWEQIHEQD